MRTLTVAGVLLALPSYAFGAELSVTFEHPGDSTRHTWVHQEIRMGELPAVTIADVGGDPWRVQLTIEELSDESVEVSAEIYRIYKNFWGRERARLVGEPRVRTQYGVEARISQSGAPEDEIVLTVTPSWSMADYEPIE